MNNFITKYIFYLKQQLIGHSLSMLCLSISYATSCYFGWRQPIDLNSSYYMAVFISYSLAFIFLNPLYLIWFNGLKK